MASTEQTTTGHYNRRRLKAVVILAFLCNIAALAFPFIDVEIPFKGTDPYNLLRTVYLMWQSELYFLSIIIVGFSVIFPFYKLATLAQVLWSEEISAKLHQRLLTVEAIGKWSMVDIFIVSFILALTHDQFLIAATPRAGIYFFIVAVVASMATSAKLAHSLAADQPGTPAHPPLSRFLSIPASLAFLGLLFVPFIEIDDWLLKDRAFTILEFLWALVQQGAPIVSLTLCIGAVIIPGYELYLLVRGTKPRLLPLLRPWSLLDVFLFSLLLFLIEGESLMSLKSGMGIILLGICMIIYIAPFVRNLMLSRRNAAATTTDATTTEERDLPDADHH